MLAVLVVLLELVALVAIRDNLTLNLIMLIAPVGSGADHLRALAQVSRTLRQPHIREALRKAENESAIRKILCPEAAKASAA